MTSEHHQFLVVGAGPTGLGAIDRLFDLGCLHDTVLLEGAHNAGGLARSVTDSSGFTWDLGGHVVFSHYEHFDRVFERELRGDYSMIERESWVRCANAWVPYPFQNNLRYLPRELAESCVAGLERAHKAGRSAHAANFAEFIDSVFGDEIATLFMRPYNGKVWAFPPEKMQHTWIGERIAITDPGRARRNLDQGLDDFGWGPNNRFRYPIYGTGALYQRLAERHAEAIRFGDPVVEIDTARRTATTRSGAVHTYEHLLSTMPLDVLFGHVLVDAPDALRRSAERLVYAAGRFVGLGIKRPCPRRWSWMYFPGEECPFYRVTYLSNYSPHITPKDGGYYSLLCEMSEEPTRTKSAENLVEETICGLERSDLLEPGERDDIVSVWHERVERSYPVPSLSRDKVLEELIPWLDDRGIASRGRFGLWKYEVSNTDHSFMQGVEWADRVVGGAPETTIGIRYEVAPDGRGRAISGRPPVAGSGEKRVQADRSP
ncbi:MAG: FAD-dependent oxidoreductase [Planctomycetota bacterium]